MGGAGGRRGAGAAVRARQGGGRGGRPGRPWRASGARQRRAVLTGAALGAVLVAAAAGWTEGAAWRAHAETVRYDVGDGVELEVSHPGTVAAGSEFAVSFLVRNGGWEDKDSVVVLAAAGGSVAPAGAAGGGDGGGSIAVIDAGRIGAGGSHGQAAEFAASAAAQPGTHYINLEYSHVLLENNEVPREPSGTDLAIPVEVVTRPRVDVAVSAPESLFAGAEFPLGIKVGSGEADLSDVRVEIAAPPGVELRGQSLHSFSLIGRGDAMEIASRVWVPPADVAGERRVPLQVSVSYTDEDGERREETRTVSPVLRPRTFMELTGDGGVWIGDFFIAPYVSLGTIIGVPAGALLSLAIRRRVSGGRGREGGGRDA